MNRDDTVRAMVRFALDRALQNMKSPQRGLRNLVDLGAMFAKSESSRAFLQAAQEILKDKKSPYYDLLQRLLEAVDVRTLSNLCVNLGYNALTRGAREIRAHAQALDTSLPLAMQVEAEPSRKGEGRAATVCGNAQRLGVHLFLLDGTEGLPDYLWGITRDMPEAAFIVLIGPDDLATVPLDSLVQQGNCLFVADAQQAGFAAQCDRLRRARLPYAALCTYTEATYAHMLTDAQVQPCVDAGCIGALYVPTADCPAGVYWAMQTRTAQYRQSPSLPMLVTDFVGDMHTVCQWVIGESRMLRMGAEGALSWVDADGNTAPVSPALRGLLTQVCPEETPAATGPSAARPFRPSV